MRPDAEDAKLRGARSKLCPVLHGDAIIEFNTYFDEHLCVHRFQIQVE
jgi:hypothetical protein